MRREINWYDVASRTMERMGDLGWEPEDLAVNAGVAKATVNKLLRPEPIKLESLLSICDAMNSSPDFLLGYLDRKKDAR